MKSNAIIESFNEYQTISVQRLFEIFDEADFWMFAVMAALMATLSGEVIKNREQTRAAGWLHVVGAISGFAYYIHLATDRGACGSEHIEIGVRALLVAFVVKGVVALLFFTLMLIWNPLSTGVRSYLFQPWARWKEARTVEPVANEPEEVKPQPTDQELDQMFEEGMNRARLRFARRCNWINSQETLDEFECEAAITTARAQMTSDMNSVMEQYG